MDPTRLMGQTCTISHVVQDGAPDPYGTPAETVTTTTSKCWLSQATRREADGEVVQQEGWTLCLPSDVSIDGGDRVAVDGVVFEVDGPPWRAVNPRTSTATHIEASVKRDV